MYSTNITSNRIVFGRIYKEKEFIEEIADATKISDFKDFFYFDGTINRGTN